PHATVRAQTIDGYARETLTETTRDFETVSPAGSLPRLVRPTPAPFPKDDGRAAFVVPAPPRAAAWRARRRPAPAPRAGLSWRSKITTAERRLEYTRLTEWARIFGVEGVSFFNLQYDDCEREIAEAETRFGITIRRWADVDYMNDFESVA